MVSKSVIFLTLQAKGQTVTQVEALSGIRTSSMSVLGLPGVWVRLCRSKWMLHACLLLLPKTTGAWSEWNLGDHEEEEE